MTLQLKQSIEATWLAKKLQLAFHGPALSISRLAPLHQACSHSLTFCTTSDSTIAQATIIAPLNFHNPTALHIGSSHPRFDFIRAFNFLEQEIGFAEDESAPKIHPSVLIGQNVLIEPGVEIGEGTQLYHNIILRRGVKIGKHCLIKSGSIIGEEGFGFERDERGDFIRMPHRGSVRIGNQVEIGALVTVCRGALSDTIIEEGVKIDDHCHIAHHCHIQAQSLLTAGVILCGGVTIGTQCWIAPRATILNKVVVGDKALVGLGAVVTQDVATDATVFGNPAKVLLKPKTPT